MKLPVLQGRCSGQCCRKMFIRRTNESDAPPLTLEEIGQSVTDGEFIADMLIPIVTVGEDAGTAFTCRHFDGHDCTVYEMRPKMCRTHGRDKQCTNDGCTLPPPTDVYRSRVRWWWKQRHKPHVREWLRGTVAWIRKVEQPTSQQ